MKAREGRRSAHRGAAAVARFQGGHNAATRWSSADARPILSLIPDGSARTGALLHRQRCGVVARRRCSPRATCSGAGCAGVRGAWRSRRTARSSCPRTSCSTRRARRARGPNASALRARHRPRLRGQGGAARGAGRRTCSSATALPPSSARCSTSIISCCSTTTATNGGLPQDPGCAAGNGRADRTAGDRRDARTARAAPHRCDVLFEGRRADAGCGSRDLSIRHRIHTTAGFASTGTGLGPWRSMPCSVPSRPTPPAWARAPSRPAVRRVRRAPVRVSGKSSARSPAGGGAAAGSTPWPAPRDRELERLGPVHHSSSTCSTARYIRVCVGYRSNARSPRSRLSASRVTRAIDPVYEELPGWHESTAVYRLRRGWRSTPQVP